MTAQTSTSCDSLKAAIRNIPDYPKPGIVFRDITTLLKDPVAFMTAHRALIERFRAVDFDLVLGIEARGFVFGGALALSLGKGFIPLRKSGKLPAAVLSETYELEYGDDTINMHTDAVATGQRVILIDDLLATGGTLAAAASLVEKAGGTVAGIGVVIELAFLAGRKKLAGYDLYSAVTYDVE
ncbi:MAG TPA: adenine phosphoribosyltransferase [Acidobacteriota bacterium]|nr:adenine phosphoribosyltransferase [Acidobacteriota bacterium]